MDKLVRLTTDRLLPRPFTMDDVGDVLEYGSDSEIARYGVYTPPILYTRKVAEELVAMFSDPPHSQGILQMLAVLLCGLIRNHTKWNGAFGDRVYYGILGEEWEVVVAREQEAGIDMR